MSNAAGTTTLNPGAIALHSATAGVVRLIDVAYRPGLAVPRHRHEHGYLCLVMAGGFTEAANGAERTGEPGSFFYYPDHLLHRGRYGARGARVLHLEIPHGDVAGLLPRGSDARVPHEDLRGRRAAALAWQLAHELRAENMPTELACEALVADVIAELFGAPPRRRHPVPSWLGTVEEILRSHDGQPPGLRAIAGEVGVHPSHLAREYRRRTGSTLGERARRLQVARAAAAISGSEAPLAEVACATGFADQSHMGRVFKTLMGTTPAAYRRALGGGRSG